MDRTNEFEYRHSKEVFMDTTGKIYSWLKLKTKAGENSLLINLLKKFFESLNDFLDADENYVFTLQNYGKPAKLSNTIDVDPFRVRYEKYFGLINDEKKEKIRRDWNDRQRQKWWDHF